MAKNRALVELLTRAGPAYSRVPARLREVPITAARERVLEVESLLHLRDGFRTLDGALYVRPSVTVAQVRGNDDWNALTLWRGTWRHATTLYFFAEDVLGRRPRRAGRGRLSRVGGGGRIEGDQSAEPGEGPFTPAERPVPASEPELLRENVRLGGDGTGERFVRTVPLS